MPTWTPHPILRSDLPLSPSRPIVAEHRIIPQRRALTYHMHFGLELGIVIRGRKRYAWRDHQRRYGPGDVWLCGMWEPHGYAFEQAPCEFVVLVIQPQMLAAWQFAEAPSFNALSPFIPAPADRPRVAKADRRAMVQLAKRIARHSNNDADNAALWLRHLLMEVLLLLPGEPAEQTPPHDLDRIDKAMQMVMQSHEPITVEQAAKACGMTRHQLTRRFEQAVGITFAQFALRYRLEGAASALLQNDAPLKAVAADWGFVDASHFHHCFTRNFGCTPATYRVRSARR